MECFNKGPKSNKIKSGPLVTSVRSPKKTQKSSKRWRKARNIEISDIQEIFRFLVSKNQEFFIERHVKLHERIHQSKRRNYNYCSNFLSVQQKTNNIDLYPINISHILRIFSREMKVFLLCIILYKYIIMNYMYNHVIIESGLDSQVFLKNRMYISCTNELLRTH